MFNELMTQDTRSQRDALTLVVENRPNRDE